MQKNISVNKNNTLANFLFYGTRGVFIEKAFKLCLLAFAFGSNTAQANVLFKDANSVSEQCHSTITSLSQIKISKKSRKPTTTRSLISSFSEFEQPIIEANNLNFSLLLAADVHPDKEVQLKARECIPQLKSALDGYYALPEIDKPLISIISNTETKKIDFLKSASRRYLKLIETAQNKAFVEKSQEASIKARAFRAGSSNKTPSSYSIDKSCAQGLPVSKTKKWQKNGELSIPSASKSVNYALARMESETCRQKLYAQHESRYQESNQSLLIDMLASRNAAAIAKGQSYWAEIAFENTMLPTANDVDDFLTSLNHPKAIEAPWNTRFNKKQNASDSKNKNKNKSKKLEEAKEANTGSKKRITSLTPGVAKQGLFKLLEKEFSLKIKPVLMEKGQIWHSTVEAYELYDLQNLAGGKPKFYGRFFLDLNPREDKYKKNRHRAIKRGVSNDVFMQHAEGALILNLPKKSWQQKHIKSFFHEFGHLLHNMVAVQKTHIEAGISMERDLVEMPSKWFEWLSFDPEIQQMMFDEVIVDNVKADEGIKYQLRLYKAAYALQYHQTKPSANEFEAINAKLFKSYTGHDYIANSGSQYSFTHLATYGPRYYTYLWSEKMALRLLQDYKNKSFSAREFFDLYLAKGSEMSTLAMLSNLYEKQLTLPEVIQWVSNPNYQFSEK